MKRSTNGILTTHVGALAHPADLHEMVQAKDEGKPVNVEMLDGAIRKAVVDIVKKQVDNGVTVVNDGEESKSNYTTYIFGRLNGFGGAKVPNPPRSHEVADFPEYFARRRPNAGIGRLACIGPLSWKDFSSVDKDIENLKIATKNVKVEDVFLSTASPGQICTRMPSTYYPTHEAYLHAMAGVMKREYDAIAKSGFTMQLDCPELALSRDSEYGNLSLAEFRKVMALHIDVLNQTIAAIPAENMRMHICWGRGEQPKTSDVPLKDIVDLIIKAKISGISVVAANGRHEFEWKVWKDVKVPEGKVLIPGVIDNTTNIVEHPETVAERLVRYAGVVGRENVIGGTDCGFGNQPNGADCDPTVGWAKMRSMAEGAAMATKELWRK